MPAGPHDSEPPHWLDPPRWWRRTRPLRWLVLLAGLAWAGYVLGLFERLHWEDRALPQVLGGDGTHPDNGLFTRVAVGVALADRFRSYAGVEAIRATLQSEGHEDFRIAMRRAPDSPRYPAYRFDTLVVDAYRHLGAEGQLSLHFFNNRLYEAEFVPVDPRSYARKLRSLELQRDANARAEKVDGHLRVASTVELAISAVGQHLGTRPYVLWQDLRLIDERALWDQRFGSIPKRIVTR